MLPELIPTSTGNTSTGNTAGLTTGISKVGLCPLIPPNAIAETGANGLAVPNAPLLSACVFSKPAKLIAPAIALAMSGTRNSGPI